MRNAWLFGGIGLVAVLVAAGVAYGPYLRYRLTAPPTPLGHITRLETVESFGNDLRARTGYRLWVVHLTPSASGDTPESSALKHWSGSAMLVDDRGEPHAAAVTEEASEDGKWTKRHLLFAIPQDRVPRALRLGETTVGLPPAARW